MTDAVEFAADFFDGRHSRRVPVRVRVADGQVGFEVDGNPVAFDADGVRVAPRIGATPQRLELPGGALLVTQDFAAVTAGFGDPLPTIAHRLESNLRFVVISMVALVVIFAAGYLYGVPWAARQAAEHIPLSIESRLGSEVLESLNAFAMKPSKLARERREAITLMFAGLRAEAGLPESVTLVFRGGGFIGPNALALPGGTVVVTDELIELMQNDNQLAAVLAHELGHVRQRHSMRMVLQSSITALVAMAVYGDASSVTGVAMTAPTALVHNGYSRDFERESDRFAHDLLARTGRRPADLGDALSLLQSKAEGPESGDSSVRRKGGARLGYFATHPDTGERIRAAQEASR